MWMTCLFNLLVFIVYQLELRINNRVIFPLSLETLTTTLMQGKEDASASSPFSNLPNKFFCGRLIIAIVSIFHPVLLHFPQFYMVLA